MAFKMKGSPYKLGGVATKSALKNYRNPQDYKVFNMGNKPTPIKQKDDMPDPTWEGTDEYRNPEDIPSAEYTERGVGRARDLETKPRTLWDLDKTFGESSARSDMSKKSPMKQVPLQPGEREDTYVYDGDDKNEIINDLEDRIEFIKEDIWNTQEGPADAPADISQGSEDQRAALELLNANLEKLYKEEEYKPE